MSNKRLTLENWLEIDPLISEFYSLKPVMGTAHWFAEALLGPELNPAVPAEVAEAFERARAVALYGVFAHSQKAGQEAQGFNPGMNARPVKATLRQVKP